MKRAHHLSSLTPILSALVAIVALLSFAHSAALGVDNQASNRSDEVVAEVRVLGNRNVAMQQIMAQIQMRAGMPIDQKLIDDDVKRLIATRQFFDVGVEKLREPHGLVVVFRVLEGNRIKEVIIEGNHSIASDKLRDKAGLTPSKDKDKTTSKTGDKLPTSKTIDIARSKDAARLMEDYYHEKDYPFARVEVVEGTQAGDKRLVFHVVEGPKVAITDVDFEFLDHDTLGGRLLATKIKTKPRKFGFFGGKYTGRDIDEDVSKLTAYFRSLGFFDAKVSRELRWSENQSQVEVKFVVFEGPQYRVRDIKFNGNQKLMEDKLTDGLKLKIGDPFNQLKLQADTQKVQDKYGVLGHIEAKVNPDIRFLEQPGEVDVVYQVVEGEPYYVGRIFVTGNHTTKDNVVRRELRIYPGELFDMTALRRSEQNLRKTQLFLANYQMGTGPALVPLGEGPNLRDVEVKLDEAQTGRILFGLGVNSDAGLIGNIIISEQNFDITRFPASFDDFIAGDAFRGGGQEFRLEAAPGTQFSRYLASWREPRLFDLPYSLGVSGHFFQRRYTEYEEDRTGGTITLGHSFTDQIRGSLGFRLENVNISNPSTLKVKDLVDVLGDNFLTTFTVGAEHDTRDNPFMATCGHLAQVSFEQAFGDFSFPQVTLEGRQYWTTTERADGSGKQVLSLRGTVGFTGSDTPIFERFYAGGFRNFRGFQFRGVGPAFVDPTTHNSTHTGGDFMLLGSLEYQIPITADDTLQGVIFSDFGTVQDDVRLSDFRVTAGFGLRVVVPMLGPVPLAFDFAFPLHSISTDDEQIFSFFVGFFR